jgi:UDP:flavonoid glycosyltransferase YjiC (YdhE family)
MKITDVLWARWGPDTEAGRFSVRLYVGLALETDVVSGGVECRAVRCLFTSKTGSLGHLLPLLPLAEAARASGDEVAVAACVDRGRDVEAAGFAFFPAGLALADMADHYQLAKQRLAASGLEVHPRLGLDFENTYAQIFPTVQAPVMASDLAKVIEEFRPDVVVCDLGEFGGPVAAAVAGVPCASHGFGLPIPESLAKEAAR